jgi:hypothetical protein
MQSAVHLAVIIVTDASCFLAGMARFSSKTIADFVGRIYETCKDQFGCRFLQRELEHRKPADVHAVWLETYQHVVELMMDPFGNYLCQKLLEYCDEDDRTKLIETASRDMVQIALNQHGTRALQKMIEHVTTPEQVAIITDALRNKVVELIQDLNGNHVIQKCLNKLSAAEAFFIFEAVGYHCVEVGTHRHGCCVLQRCIDHAAGEQKRWLVDRITENAAALVVDPFGNYVVQYIIDLNEPAFTEPLVRMFAGNIVSLSKHKFSSNVIEKCLRCALDPSKDLIVAELLTPGEMDRILKDGYANYVVQTALDYATLPMKNELVRAIRPHLQAIRHTPYGRRIQTKIIQFDANQLAAAPPPMDTMVSQVNLRNPGAAAMPATVRTAVMVAGNDNGDGLQDTCLRTDGTYHRLRPMVQPAPFFAIDAVSPPGVHIGRPTSSVARRHQHPVMTPPKAPMPRTPRHHQLPQMPIMGSQDISPQSMMHMTPQGHVRGRGQPNMSGFMQPQQHHIPPSPAITPQHARVGNYGFYPTGLPMGMDDSAWL